MKEFFKSKKNLVISIVSLLVLVIGITFAILAWRTNNYKVTMDTSCFNINYSIGQDISATLSPIYEPDYVTNNNITINGDMTLSTISIGFDEACTRYSGRGTIEINTSSIDNAFTSNGDSYNSLKYALVPYNSEDYDEVSSSILEDEEFEILASGSINSTGTIDIYSMDLEPGDLYEYLIIFYIDSNLIDEDVIGASFSSRIDTRVEQNLVAPEPGDTGRRYTPLSDFLYVTGNGTSNTHITSIELYGFEDNVATDMSNRTEVTYEPNGLYLDGDAILLTGYTGNSTEINIPDTYTVGGRTYHVIILSYIHDNTGLRNSSNSLLASNQSVKSIYLDDNVGSVEYYIENGWDFNNMHGAFRYATSLESISIPNNFHYYDCTFAFDTSLKNVEIRGTNERILDSDYENRDEANSAFAGTSQNITITYTMGDVTPLSDFLYVKGNGNSSGTVQIDEVSVYTFIDNTSTAMSNKEVSEDWALPESYIMNNNVLLITGYKGNSTSINIPNYYVVDGTRYRVKVLSYVKEWQYGALSLNNIVEEIKIGDDVTAVEYGDEEAGWVEDAWHRAFYLDTELERVTLPRTATTLDSSFGKCFSLEEVNINSSFVTNAYTMLFDTRKKVVVNVPYGSTTYSTLSRNDSLKDMNGGVAVVNFFGEASSNSVEDTPISDFYYLLGSDSTTIDELPLYMLNDGQSSTALNTRSLSYNSDFPSLEIEEDDILLTGYKGMSKIISIPNTYTVGGNTYNVKILAHFTDDSRNVDEYGLLNHNHYVEEIYIGDNVTSIGYYPDEGDWMEGYDYGLFRFDTSLRKVNRLPSDVNNLVSAFAHCHSLEDAPVVPSTAGLIDDLFYQCYSLKGTVRIECSSCLNGNEFSNAFGYDTNFVNNFTMQVPNSSNTYNALNNGKPANVTLVGF